METKITQEVPGIGLVVATVEVFDVGAGQKSRYVKSAVYGGTGREVTGAPLDWVRQYLGY